MTNAYDDDAARKDAEKRRPHYETDILHAPEPTPEPANANGRSGLLLRLNGKQVGIALGIAVTLASGAVAVWTREPSKGDVSASSRPNELRTEQVTQQLQALQAYVSTAGPQVAAHDARIEALERTRQEDARRQARLEDKLDVAIAAINDLRLMIARRQRLAGAEGGPK